MRLNPSVVILWDASGLAKRYVSENGSQTVNALFASGGRLAATLLGYAETYSILLRRLNDRRLDVPTFTAAVLAQENEVLASLEFDLLSVDDASILSSIALMKRHNLNSSDAVILALFLRYARQQAAESVPCLLVAADQRLLRAAAAEGLATLNPESVSAAAVPALLAAV